MEVLCSKCNAPMSCNPEHDCWCAEFPRVLPVPDKTTQGCFCRNCLEQELALFQISPTRLAGPTALCESRTPRVQRKMCPNAHHTASTSTPIRIAAAVIEDLEGRVLLVRKFRTRFFMQPGGKLQDAETPLEALARELEEELRCSLLQSEFLGTFSAPAANEPQRTVEAFLFWAKITGSIQPAAEIEEILWIDPSRLGDLSLAPLTWDHVLPLILSRES